MSPPNHESVAEILRDTKITAKTIYTGLATDLFLTSVRSTPQALLQLVRDRWSIEGWHWVHDTQLHEVAHRCRGYGAGVMATLRTAAHKLLQLAGFRSIRSGMQAVVQDNHGPAGDDQAEASAHAETLNQP